MSHRPLALVSGLTLGDYLLWNWSLSGSHDVVALVSGLTLPPLAVASVWLLALTLARLIARATAGSERAGVRAPAARRHAGRDPEDATNRPATARTQADGAPAPATRSSGPSSGKLAA